MARQIDLPPIYDPITAQGYELSNVWRDYLSRIMDTLNEYLSENGMFIPRLTQDEIKKINPTRGQVVYNLTVNAFQGYEGNQWKTFTLV